MKELLFIPERGLLKGELRPQYSRAIFEANSFISLQISFVNGVSLGYPKEIIKSFP